MAQFGKHLFGTSYFGKTNTFDGDYLTEVIDAGDPFTGPVDVALKAILPPITYLATSKDFHYVDKTNWTFSGTSATSKLARSEVSMLFCASKIVIDFVSATGKGGVVAEVVKLKDDTITYHNLDTAVSGKITIDLPYGNYLIKIKPTSILPVTLKSLTAMVGNIGVEVRTASTYINNVYNWSSYIPVNIALNPSSGKYEGSSASVTDKRFVQVLLHLATSDSNSAPIADAITISSGDITKYAEYGQWFAAVNLTNAAADSAVTFKRTKRLEWKEVPTAKSTMTLKSTSITSAGLKTIPSDSEVLDGSYWKPETAQYFVKRTGAPDFGVPISRLSLGEKENGFTNSSTNASVTIGPLNTLKSGFADTKLVSWVKWNAQLFYPTNKNNTSLSFELYKNKGDAGSGIAPIFIVSAPELMKNKAINLPKESFSESIYLRIVIQRTAGRQSPVIDYLDLTAHMAYTSSSALGKYSDTLCGLDNVLAATSEKDMGKKNLRTIAHTIFNWPGTVHELPENTKSIVQDNKRNLKIEYKPKYSGQVNVGFGENLAERVSFNTLDTPSLPIKSKVTTKEPQVSMQQVPANQLYYHYTYDGGTVNFPNTTERDLSTDFTPNLLNGKKYRFYLTNGWKQETFQLPYSMPWAELAEMVDFKEAEMKQANPNVKLYEGKLSMGFVVNLPNKSKNPLIQLSFKSTGNSLTEKSIWNGTANEDILASIPKGGIYQYEDWVSDEIIYNGILNASDLFSSYARTQIASYETRQESTYRVIATTETAKQIAQLYSVSVDDLVALNNKKTAFKKGESVLIPSSFSLPEIDPGVIYQGNNPFVVEVVPDSVRRTKDETMLSEDILISGSDDEPGIQYTLKESTNIQVTLKRGSIPNGKEVVPFSNVMKIVSVKNVTSGVVYSPYVKTGTSEIGDYKLVGNTIDWSATHSTSKEPAVGQDYIVTFTHGIVDTLKIIYTSAYKEKSAYDKLWRSVEVKEMKGTVTPEKDLYLTLPTKESFSDFKNYYTGVEYIVEDNDLWVKTSIKKVDGKPVLFATLNGEDPKRNWYPTVQTGFYYLNDQEHYLYSEPVEKVYGKEEVPIIKKVRYSSKGLSLN